MTFAAERGAMSHCTGAKLQTAPQRPLAVLPAGRRPACSAAFKAVSHGRARPQRRRLPPPSAAPADGLAAAAVAEAPAPGADGGDKSVPRGDAWELDFCSRPMLDERGKKVWELLVCSPDRSFEFARYFPNNKINSGELRHALEEVLAAPGAERPQKVRFFRGQMQTIISRALGDLGLAAVPSRRCFALLGWLEERLESVYKQHPGYTDRSPSLFQLDLGAPEELPGALRGERWAFVQLPLGALQAELADVAAGRVFGQGLDLALLPPPPRAGAGGERRDADAADAAAPPPQQQQERQAYGPDTLVPGVAVYSRRADPLAAWTAGLELAAVKADVDRAFLILESGVNQRWRYGAYRRSPEAAAEAAAWEEAKRAAGGLHFLAVMEDEESETCSGLWLLLERDPPSV
eukprot:scaffold28.g7562.t1